MRTFAAAGAAVVIHYLFDGTEETRLAQVVNAKGYRAAVAGGRHP